MIVAPSLPSSSHAAPAHIDRTQFVNGCAADGGVNPATTNTFTPVVKVGAAQDSIFITCVASS
jgi:hypothetical protein